MARAALAARFALIVDLLRRSVAARGAKGALAAPLVVLLWTRLRRAATRFEALATGTAGKQARARHPDPRRDTSSARPRRDRLDLPRRSAWLLGPVPEAAGAAGQLRHLLADPELETLLRAEPRLGRILRPLCRHLGIAPPQCLRLARPPQPPQPPAGRRTGRRPGSRPGQHAGNPARERTSERTSAARPARPNLFHATLPQTQDATPEPHRAAARAPPHPT